MITNQEILLEYFTLTQKLLKDYTQKLYSELQKEWFTKKDNNNYIFVLAKNNHLSSIAKIGKKISYGNLMPENLDKILPFNDKSLDSKTITNAQSRLEKLAITISNKKIVGFAFENGISLNILGEKFEYSQLENSLLVPLEAAESGGDLIPYMEECMLKKKGLWRRMRELF